MFPIINNSYVLMISPLFSKITSWNVIIAMSASKDFIYIYIHICIYSSEENTERRIILVHPYTDKHCKLCAYQWRGWPLFQVDLSRDITLKKIISWPKHTQLQNLSNSIGISEDHSFALWKPAFLIQWLWSNYRDYKIFHGIKPTYVAGENFSL